MFVGLTEGLHTAQDVSDDYEQRISESSIEVEAGVSKSLEKLLGGEGVTIAHCNCNGNAGAIGGDCLNISVCAHTTGKDKFDVVAWNVMAHPLEQMMRIPVSTGGNYTVTNLATKQTLMAQVSLFSAVTLSQLFLFSLHTPAVWS